MTEIASVHEPSLPALRPLASGRGWRATEFICTSGPGDRAFEERHEHVTIAGVLDGFFTYRSGKARAVLHTGALLLGNAGACYECGHEHGRGDRCVAIHFDPDVFGEITASVAGSSAFQFPAPVLSPPPAVTATLARLGAASLEPMARDVAVIQLAELVVRAMSSGTVRAGRFSTRDEQRVLVAVAFIEANASGKLDLDELSNFAGTSKYHFLRIFRRHVGVTPYRFIVDLRLRRAASALATSQAPVSEIAFEMGFGDLSTFYRQFNAAFGASPQRYRQRHGAQRPRA